MKWLTDFFGVGYVRLIAAGIVVALIAFAGWRVSAWHEAYGELQSVEARLAATETALEQRTTEFDQCTDREAKAYEAYAEAARATVEAMQRDREAAERIERDLQTRLATADDRGRDLARRLLDATRAAARPVACPGQAAAEATGRLADASGEPGGDAALGAVFAACNRDAERLNGWIAWWREVAP